MVNRAKKGHNQASRILTDCSPRERAPFPTQQSPAEAQVAPHGHVFAKHKMFVTVARVERQQRAKTSVSRLLNCQFGIVAAAFTSNIA